MIFSISRDVLENCTAVISQYSSPNVPYVAVMHIVASDMVTFEATNLDRSSARVTVAALVEEEGECVVPARLLAGIVKTLPDAAVTVETTGTQVNLQCGKTKFRLPVGNIDEFPGLPKIDYSASSSIGFDQFASMVKRVSTFVSKNDSKPILGAINMTTSDGYLRMVATDSYKLFVSEIDFQGDFSFIMNGRFASDVARMHLTDDVFVASFENHIGIQCGEWEFISRAIEGRYPNYKSIIPETTEDIVEVDREVLLLSVKRAEAICADNPLQIGFGEGELYLSVDTSTGGQMDDIVSCVRVQMGNEKEPVIKVNPFFLNDALSSLQGDSVRIGINNPLKPMKLSCKNDIAVIMPVR